MTFFFGKPVLVLLAISTLLPAAPGALAQDHSNPLNPFRIVLGQGYRQWHTVCGKSAVEPREYLFKLDAQGDEVRLARLRQETMTQLKERLEAFGLQGSMVRPEGTAGIVIQLILEPEHVDSVIKNLTSSMSFSLREVVDQPGDYRALLESTRGWSEANGVRFRLDGDNDYNPTPRLLFSSREGLDSFISHAVEAGLVGQDRLLAYQAPDSGYGNDSMWILLIVTRETLITYLDVESATIGFSPMDNMPFVSFSMKPEGATRFEEFTASHVRRRLAIMLDHEVKSAPVIMERIAGGRAQITLGNGKGPVEIMNEARATRAALLSGGLPAGLVLERELTMDPDEKARLLSSTLSPMGSLIGLMLQITRGCDDL